MKNNSSATLIRLQIRSKQVQLRHCDPIIFMHYINTYNYFNKSVSQNREFSCFQIAVICFSDKFSFVIRFPGTNQEKRDSNVYLSPLPPKMVGKKNRNEINKWRCFLFRFIQIDSISLFHVSFLNQKRFRCFSTWIEQIWKQSSFCEFILILKRIWIQQLPETLNEIQLNLLTVVN